MIPSTSSDLPIAILASALSLNTEIVALPKLLTCNGCVVTDVPIPTVPLAIKLVEIVATPIVAPAILTSASLEREEAVDAVPVKLPITFPVIAPMKLPDEIADAVRIPTVRLGVPTRSSAPVATPTNLPLNVVAVRIPARFILVGNLSLARIGSLSLLIVP